MSEVLKEVIRQAIEMREYELDELRAKLEALESEDAKPKRKRFRKSAGPKAGSIPSLIMECLREAGKPLAAAEISERLTKKGKPTESRFVAAALHRYVKAGRIFTQNDDGSYSLKK